MNYKKQLTIPLFLMLFSSLSMAMTDYTAIENWKVYDNNPSGATVKPFGKRILFKGDGRKNSYLNGFRNATKGWNNTKEHILEWDMKFSEKFRIVVYIQTQKGRRILFYDYKNKDKGLYKKRYIHMGLGSESMNNTMQSFSRDLGADLKKYESDNKIIAVNGFKVQGSGSIDSLKLLSEADKNQRNALIIEKAKEYCLEEDNSTSTVLCSNEKNIVYIVDTKKIDFDTNNNNIYRVSIEKNKENVEIIRKDIQGRVLYPIEYFQLIKLKNTPIYLMNFVSSGADLNVDWSFMYKDKVLFSQHSNDREQSLYDIHTDELGKKLIFSYEQGYTEPYGIYTLTYDISNPNEMILIDKDIKSLR